MPGSVRALALLFLLLSSSARAETQHYVFGLDPAVAYDVRQGDSLIAQQIVPGPAGDIAFSAPGASSITIIESAQDTLVTKGDVLPSEQPFPNPCAGGFRLRLSAGRAPGARVLLFDAAGRSCGRLDPEGGPDGGSFRWNDERSLASGVYFLQIRAAGSSLLRKIIVRK